MSEQTNENQVIEEVEVENDVEETSFFSNLMSMLFLVCVIFLVGLWIRNTVSERNFCMEMYGYAVDEVREHCVNALNLKIDKYKKEYISFQTMEYQDFGDGELRYFKYAVRVPIEYDTTFNHLKRDITITVYYYTSNQNISEGVDETVPAHFYVMDMYADWYDLFP